MMLTDLADGQFDESANGDRVPASDDLGFRFRSSVSSGPVLATEN